MYAIKTGRHSFHSTLKGDFFEGKLCNGDKVIINILRILRASDGTNSNSAIFTQIAETIAARSALTHPAILSIYGTFLEGPHIGVIHTGVAYQDIIGYLKGKTLSPQSMLHLVKRIISGLDYLHENSVFLGYMWGRSILIGENEEPLIADSGLDFLIRSSERYRKIEVTCRWEAPELLLPADDMATPVPTAASDIYAFAMTVQEMYTLRPPFDEVERDTQFVVKLMGGSLEMHMPDNMPPEVWLVLQDCRALDPGARPTASEVLLRLEALEV